MRERIPDQIETDWSDSQQWFPCNKNEKSKHKSYYARDSDNGLFAVLFEGRKGADGHKWGAYLKIDGADYRAKPIITIYGNEILYLMQSMELERLRFLLRAALKEGYGLRRMV